MNATEVLIAAKERLVKQGWVQRAFWSVHQTIGQAVIGDRYDDWLFPGEANHASYCARGAIKQGFIDRGAGRFISYNDLSLPEAESHLAAVIREQYPERRRGKMIQAVELTDSTVIVEFNDSPETTMDEVIAVFEKAIARSEELVDAG